MPKWWPQKGKSNQADLAHQAEEQAYQATVTELRQQFADQRQAGISRQAILKQIQSISQALEQAEMTPPHKGRLRAYDQAFAELRSDLMRILQTGRAMEIAGRVDEAISYYETAVTEQMSTRFPYEHLRIIYRQRQQYADARRICQAALQNPFLPPEDKAHFQTWADKLAAAS